ncbi:MAG: hypothetical protein AAGF24_01260 [Cyanobacteria bacterium P01_H01_bin.121]
MYISDPFQGLGSVDLAWLLAHPYLAIASVLGILLVAQIIFGALSDALRALLILLLRSPLHLVQGLASLLKRPFKRSPNHALNQLEPKLGVESLEFTPELRSQMVAKLRELEGIQKQYDQVLSDLKIMLDVSKGSDQRSKP